VARGAVGLAGGVKGVDPESRFALLCWDVLGAAVAPRRGGAGRRQRLVR